jgi:hypothetical protein
LFTPQLVLINNDLLVWDRKKERGFPEVSEIKRKVRDVVAPNRNLGHNEVSSASSDNLDDVDDDEMDDDESAELRSFYGVL